MGRCMARDERNLPRRQPRRGGPWLVGPPPRRTQPRRRRSGGARGHRVQDPGSPPLATTGSNRRAVVGPDNLAGRAQEGVLRQKVIDLIDIVIAATVLIGLANGYRRGFWLSAAQYAGLVVGVLLGGAGATPAVDHSQV